MENLPDIIRDRKMLPNTIKKNITNSIFFNCLLFIIMMAITLIINVSFNELNVKDFDSYIDIIQIFCAIISVVVLEVAYRKDSGKIAFYGIELLVFSICVLFVPYMYIVKDNIYFLKNSITAFGIYYIVKSVTSFLHTRNKYLRENMSDIKELVKEEKQSYIDEESTKILKAQKFEVEKRKKSKEENIKSRKNSSNKEIKGKTNIISNEKNNKNIKVSKKVGGSKK